MTGLPLALILSALRIEPADLSVRPERWDTRSKLAAVEGLLEDPASTHDRAGAWLEQLRRSEGAGGVDLAGTLLEAATVQAEAPSAGLIPAGLFDPPLELELERLAEAVARAQPLLDRALASIPAELRPSVERQMLAELVNDDSFREDPALFDAADRFDVADVLAAEKLVVEAVEAAKPRLQAYARTSGAVVRRRRLETPIGTVLVSGSGDDVYTAAELSGAALIVDLGGRDRFEGPAAAAGPGQIRVVVDFGSDVVVESSGPAASGLFGIGALFLPNSEGKKTLRAGDLSLGAGLFGAGWASVAGKIDASAGRFAFGAGAYGLGWFDSTGDGASLEARLAAQGLGYTKGAGFFRVRGSNARLRCGLVEPDPREDLATLGFCQGAGLGPRAFAAGGVGLAVVEGADSDLESGYFAQGSGYWHSLGALLVAGARPKLKARRYDMGAGIHTALGFLSVEGSSGTIVNWGVGPAYGWDFGVGAFSLVGSGNSLYAEWGVGHGDINGRALARVRGDGNRLQLPDFGSGGFRRNEPSWGLAVVEGSGNEYRWPSVQTSSAALRLSVDPYGLLDAEGGLVLSPTLELPKPTWPKIDRSEAERKERERLEARLAAADKLSGGATYAEWLSVASNFGLDSKAPAQALAKLCALPESEVPALVGLVSPDRFDEWVWLRALLASRGAAAAEAASAASALASGTRKALLLGLARYAGPSRALETASRVEKDPDWRVRREAAAILGWEFGREKGEEPGRLTLLETLRDVARSGAPPEGGPQEKALFDRLGRQRLTDALAALSLSGLDSAEVQALFSKVPGPTEALEAPAWREVFSVLASRKSGFEKALSAELESARALAPKAREALLGELEDPEPEVVQATLVGLSQMGRAEDVPRIASFAEDRRALLRESAAGALGKLGVAARGALRSLLASPSPRTRSLAAAGAARSSDPETLALLAGALVDADEGVRRTAVAAILDIPGPERGVWASLRPPLERVAARDPSPSVRACAAYALTRVR